jgi:hypothetical protein
MPWTKRLQGHPLAEGTLPGHLASTRAKRRSTSQQVTFDQLSVSAARSRSTGTAGRTISNQMAGSWAQLPYVMKTTGQPIRVVSFLVSYIHMHGRRSARVGGR